jgi:hypothetical protein
MALIAALETSSPLSADCDAIACRAVVDFRDVNRDVQIAHAEAKHRNDLTLDLVAHMGLVFLH